ncbi:hypothetical protein KY317_03245 [Candidatus Woesearchaeota archaeon]|nr:hypothetical protein [Candidatus Woesearchaeota archaeon]
MAIMRPKEKGEPLYAKHKKDDSVQDLLALLRGESVYADREDKAEREAGFYRSDYDDVIAVNPELADLPQDDSRVIKDFFQKTSVESANEEPCNGHPPNYPLKKYPSL